MDDNKCEAITASGNQCKQSAKEGSQFCGLHSKGELAVVGVELPRVHHIMRFFARKGLTIPEGAFAGDELDAYLSYWVGLGYKLFNTHYLGENPEGFGFMYILVKDD